MTKYEGLPRLDSPTTQLSESDFAAMELASRITLTLIDRRDIQVALDHAERVWSVTNAERPDKEHPARVKLANALKSLRDTLVEVSDAIRALDDFTAVMLFVDRDDDYLIGSPPGTEPFARTVELLHRNREALLEQLHLLERELKPLGERATLGLREADIRPSRRPKNNAPLSTFFYTLADVFERAGGHIPRSGRKGPWARFLGALWERLPGVPFKPSSPDAFVQASLAALATRRKKLREVLKSREH